MRNIMLTIMCLGMLAMVLTGLSNSTFAGDFGLSLNNHASSTGSDHSSVRNDLPQIVLIYTFSNNCRLWGSYEENTNMYYGRRAFEVKMPGIGAGYQFINNDKWSLYTDAGIYLPKFEYMHGYKEALNVLTFHSVKPRAVYPKFTSYEAEAKWGLGFTLGSNIKLTDHIHAGIGFRYFKYDWSIEMNNHDSIPKGEPGSKEWWFTKSQEQYSAFVGIGYSF